MSAVLAIAGADAKERMRRFAFVVTIAAALYAGYLYVPGPQAPYHTVIINGHGGIYNSAFYAAAIAALIRRVTQMNESRGSHIGVLMAVRNNISNGR